MVYDTIDDIFALVDGLKKRGVAMFEHDGLKISFVHEYNEYTEVSDADVTQVIPNIFYNFDKE